MKNSEKISRTPAHTTRDVASAPPSRHSRQHTVIEMRMSDCTPERARGGTRPTSEGRFPEEFAARQTIPTQRAIPRKSKNDYLMGFEPKTRGRQAGVLPVGHEAKGAQNSRAVPSLRRTKEQRGRFRYTHRKSTQQTNKRDRQKKNQLVTCAQTRTNLRGSSVARGLLWVPGSLLWVHLHRKKTKGLPKQTKTGTTSRVPTGC